MGVFSGLTDSGPNPTMGVPLDEDREIVCWVRYGSINYDDGILGLYATEVSALRAAKDALAGDDVYAVYRDELL